MTDGDFLRQFEGGLWLGLSSAFAGLGMLIGYFQPFGWPYTPFLGISEPTAVLVAGGVLIIAGFAVLYDNDRNRRKLESDLSHGD